jgi:hypothetical protein
MTKVLLITGPAGAGKTSTAGEFLKQAEGTWAYINQDEVRQLVRTGYATAGGYESDWSEATRQQWEVSIPICCDIASRYQAYGINCIIDFNSSPEEFINWEKYLGNMEYKLIVLLPDEETVLLRNKNRDGRSRLKDKKITQNYKKLVSWKNENVAIIDNSEGNVTDTIVKLNDLVK